MSIPHLLLYLFLPYALGQDFGLGKENLPYYTEVPTTNFRCEDQPYAGYYSDPEAECQLFHICVRQNNIFQQYSFLCPNETVFDQERMVCVWWDGFDCASATSLYYVNEAIFEDSEEEGRGRQFIDDEDFSRDLVRPRGRAVFQNENQISSSEGVLTADFSSQPSFGKSLTSGVGGPIPNIGVSSRNVKQTPKLDSVPKSLIRSKITSSSLNRQNTNRQTIGKTLLHSTNPTRNSKKLSVNSPNKINQNNIGKKRPVSSVSKLNKPKTEKISSININQPKNRNVNSVLDSKQILNNIVNLPFTQLTSPFQITVPVGQPKLEAPIDIKNFNINNTSKKPSKSKIVVNQAPRSKQVSFKQPAKLPFKEEKKKLKKNGIINPFQTNLVPTKQRGNNQLPVQANTRRFGSNSVRKNSAAKTSKSRGPTKKKFLKERVKSKISTQVTTTPQPRRSYLPTAQTTASIRNTKPVSKGRQKSFSHNKSRPRKPFSSSFGEGVSSYDILHELLKNITVIRSENLAKPNRGFGRSFTRNKRLDNDHFETKLKTEAKLIDNKSIINQKKAISSNLRRKTTSKCVYNAKTKTFTGCSSKVLNETIQKPLKQEHLKQNIDSKTNKEKSSYLTHSSINPLTEKTTIVLTSQKPAKLSTKKGLASRGKKKFSVEKFLNPLKLDFTRLSSKPAINQN